MIKAAIIHGAGYNAGELIRLLVNHPDVTLVSVQSDEHAGKPVTSVHHGLVGDTDLRFTPDIDYKGVDIVFSCLPNGKAAPFFEAHPFPDNLRVIDLSADFRLPANPSDIPDNDAPQAPADVWVYGLPELNRKPMVRGARLVANPGSFAMIIELALLPLARNLLLNSNIHITAITGSTVEGHEPTMLTHFPRLNDNVEIYDPLTHRHLAEITQTLRAVQASFNSEIDFIPVRAGFSRGILAAIYLDCPVDTETLCKLYEDSYSDHNFTYLVDRRPDLKDVAGTNKCLIHLEKIGSKLLITAAIDNLLKGAAGTAVHNMNLLFGLSERTALNLHPTAF